MSCAAVAIYTVSESNVLTTAITSTSISSEGTDYPTSAVAFFDVDTTKIIFIKHTPCQELG